MQPLKVLFCLALFPVLAFVSPGSRIEVIGLKMESKTLEKGYYNKVAGEVFFYPKDGKMLTHITYPQEIISTSNYAGEMAIYDPKSNSVVMRQSPTYSSKENWVYQFLSQTTNDMGLEIRGFSLYDTRFEDDLMITKWVPPVKIASVIKNVELVHRDFKPVFMGYENPDGTYMRKVYFTNYKQIDELFLPQKITEIGYFEGGDSVITSTTFSEILINEQVTGKYAHFTIPADAKREE